ncbi:heavy metal translocating P-type ATPase [Paracnuella aquatica]|uniref:heavy metal translocating P-type ATPase n=1 Tax=Paracnuella aquatica TaxID=2268757 RepID=UPI000DEF55C6|nr:heavy metal translocating P-type ATPase [Paracnuella aquatica]RPD43470.1 cadmium-translocating P-type ATPase [Paracnuella aquatica]
MEQRPNEQENKGLALDQLSKVVESGEEKEKANNDGYNLPGDIQNNPATKKIKVDMGLKENWNLLVGLGILVIVLVLEYGFKVELPNVAALIINGIAYLFAGYKVLDLAFRKSKRGDFFNEFVLMSVATLGAFLIGEYDEGVAVMVFYGIGEWFQSVAVKRAKASIKALLDIRPEEVTVLRNGAATVVHPSEVDLGDTIQMKPGEKVALDGELVSESASFNTAALTGESKPDTKYKGEPVLAGMINLNTVSTAKVTAAFKDSKLSKILEMVQDATARKSQTQLFISRFAKVYTPIVFFLALALVVVPYFIVDEYLFYTWFYRALVFLVISCPCALVVSIPLGYFGGIGLASRNGILFKGGNFLDVMTKVNAVVMDKTGTLTKGVFRVQQVVSIGIDEKELVKLTAALEKNSTHPIAKAVTEYAGDVIGEVRTENVEEISGHGMKGVMNGKEVLAGNAKLLKKFNIAYSAEIESIVDTLVVVAINNQYSGYITIADEIKEDAEQAIKDMHSLNIKTVMLSGDKQSVVDQVAKRIGIDEAYGDLLPEGKVEKVQALKDQGRRIAFVGDGVNDAPVVALADAGIAMGGLGSDATIETADIVIQNDQPSKIVSAIKAGKLTRQIVWQNIFLAMTVKIIVLALGAGGVANLWEAVIADVGVALVAIMNAVRIQRMKI